jgi:2-polyprenyl-6-methoxyphenol hydroxylase-like FAD-dependent oxidoreductase
MSETLDVCIRGSGIVAHTLALLLARERLRVGLVAAAPVASASRLADVRAYALNHSSKSLLESLRCWPAAPAVTPVRHMRVQGDQGGELSFDAQEQGVPALGWIVDVPSLEAQLAQAVRFQPQVELLSAPRAARLTAVCEGRASSTRAEFGVDFEVTPYAQHALATRIDCEQPHGSTARQWFSAQGEILAFLPLGEETGKTVAIVWSVSPDNAARLRDASPEDFCAELEAASQHSLGAVQLSSPRCVWPLQKAQARQWSGHATGGAWVLAGDAAHNVHPLAGQGLNLGLADAAELARVLHEREDWRDIGDAKLLRRYERSRKAGMLALDAGMDGLQLLFSRPGSIWSTLRNWGMNGVQHSGMLKQWMARQAMDF